ncbi:MgtC/SapB family protein [Evtepia gabavorous]|uniref:MgtC/SapB family protein n=1 Tax=Evtepia gabavorous TaxID=2211183 RepID=UPI003A92D055
MILSKYAFFDSIPGNARGADASRIASQVVSGISFLGAGVIFKHGLSVRGLTTAAGIWATSAVGMAVGAGMYLVGAFETIVLVVIQVTLHRHPLGNDVKAIQEIMVCMNNSEEKYQLLHEFLEEHAAQIAESDMERQGDMLKIKMVVRVDIPITYEEALGFMNSNDGIYQIAV